MVKKSLLIGRPRKYPQQMADVLLKFFRKSPNIKKAYLAQVFDPTTGEPPHITIGIVMNTEIESIKNDLEKIIQENCAQQEFIDFVCIDTQDKKNLFSSLEPFYISLDS